MTSQELQALPSKAADHRYFYGKDTNQFGDLRVPSGPGPYPVVILIHGGCWKAEFASLRDLAPMGDVLKSEGIATWNIEYRRLPEAGSGWPGTFLDIGRGVDFLRSIAASNKLDLERIIVVGHSAGGTLALWAAARAHLPRSSPLYVVSPLSLRGVIDLAGTGDFEALFPYQQRACGEPVVDELLRGTPDDSAQNSPIVQASAATAVTGIATNFMPPSVSFTTLAPGGWTLTASAHGCIDCQSSLLPATFPGLDTSQCCSFRSSSYIRHNLGEQRCGGLDTTPIGGNYGNDATVANYPQGYMIGAGHATPGAYESYYTNNDYTGTVPTATGMMVEDVNGNYNFQPTDTAEYFVAPNDPDNNNLSSVTIFNQPFANTTMVYTPPSNQGTNGFWLLKLNRATLSSDPGCSQGANPPPNQISLINCGTFTRQAPVITRRRSMRSTDWQTT